MKFNERNGSPNATINYEGAPAHKLEPELALYTLVCNSLIEEQFYRSGSDQLKEIQGLVKLCDPGYVHKLAKYARKEMYMRSVPVVLVVNLVILHPHYPRKREAVADVIQRVDEITEVLSYFGSINPNATGEKPLAKAPKSILKAIKDIFEGGRFDEYQYAKYDRAGAVQLRDALFLSHAKPMTDAQQGLFKRIVEQELETPFTWETELSKGENRTETWERLIESKRVPYMATLRNLRNILNANVSTEHVRQVADYIASDAVLKAKQFPFRFWAAYRELREIPETRKTQTILAAIEKAIVKSVQNYPPFKENVLVACDTSGSMSTRLSDRSTMTYMEVGLVFGSLLTNTLPNAMMGQFGLSWALMERQEGVLPTAEHFIRRSGEVGHATNGHLVIEWLLKKKVMVDQVLMFTDLQLWNSRGCGGYYGNQPISMVWPEYQKMNPKAELWLFDLAGYGNTPLKVQGNVRLVAGWSDKVFDAVEHLINGKSMVEKIKSYQ